MQTAELRGLDKALQAWTGLLGGDRALDRERARARYGQATEGLSRKIAAALLPASVEEVAGIVNVAREHRVPLYPISAGRNWGYGSASPIVDGCALVDLSGMNKILEMDERLGLVTIQPGVTQGDLYEYLKSRNLPFMVPVTGAGPSASLVGNALERGFGNLVPDIFSIVNSLEAVLPDGKIYRSAMAEMGAVEADRAFKWGVGPYLDGLFTQGNFGIVTQMTFALPALPERIDEFLFRADSDRDLEKIIVSTREAFKSVGAFLCMVRIQEPVRLFASVGVPYPSDETKPGKTISPALLAKMRKRYKIGAWTGSGRMYGPSGVMDQARKIVKEILGPASDSLKFFKREIGPDFYTRPEHAENAVIVPTELGMNEAYWKSGEKPESGADPARDGAGLIWYAPIIPMKAASARAYVDMVRKTTVKFGIDPAPSVVATSYKYFYGITPIIFNRDDEKETSRAHACWEALLKAGKKEGFFPYRVPSQAMGLIVDPAAPFWKLAKKLKDAVDPEGILAPGRYSIL